MTVSVNDRGSVSRADFSLRQSDGGDIRLGDLVGVSPESSPARIWTNTGHDSVEVLLRARGYDSGTLSGTLLAQP
ncbi:hypothetical protein ACFV0T_22705 [Streptomyces sp. NPDC059582]|uniref:hypothetical protein n=1 Tax=Streptomyces sp. NPDC059582 TaxID=3346875 RepID=UPI0036C0D47B